MPSAARANPLRTPESKKRSSTGPDSQSKRPRHTLNNYFSPVTKVHSATSNSYTKVTLNDEQRDVYRMVVEEGKNVFFTGQAGTGKSLLLRAIIAALRRKYASQADVISITASTGMAASNIGGMTIHSWGAISPTVKDVETTVKCIRRSKAALKRWKTTKVLIIDEISMVDGPLFDLLAKVGDRLRGSIQGKSFGGIQVVMTGDFFQLPPVTKGMTPTFAFESASWKSCIDETIMLTEVYRQRDTKFVDILNEVRVGNVSPMSSEKLKLLARPLNLQDLGISPTELFPLRRDVDKSNAQRLSAIEAASQTFYSRDSGVAEDEQKARLLANMIAPENLELKIGAQVMLIKNVDQKLVNGTIGVVVGFYLAKGNRLDGRQTKTSIREVKLMDDKSTPVFLPKDVDKENGASDQKPDSKGSTSELLPLVRFVTPQGYEAVLLAREEFRAEDNEGKVLARRMQLPLILAWAMSIHKAQGQTIKHLKVDLAKIFEKGQSYVALSRAECLDGLQVLNFQTKKVMAHQKVVEWSKTITCKTALPASINHTNTTTPSKTPA